MALPNGQVLVSTGLTPPTLLAALQLLSAQVVGLNPQGDGDSAYAQVRVDWQPAGQPAWGINDDIVALAAYVIDDEYSAIRDCDYAPNDTTTVRATYSYTRVWQARWHFYGPQCFPRAQLMQDSLLIDWGHDALAASNLYLVEAGRPQYVPELFQGQWWQRADLSARFNESVTVTVLDGTIASAEVIGVTERGTVLDVQV
jgi:hypothetical protein